ncbi:MAG TPA: zincin-like metallopeptidase domain-containing protein [Rhizomicrobium sp.]|jgi:antirestriction protein ArdC
MTSDVPSHSESPSKFNVYAAITAKIVRAMAENKGKFEMPWHTSVTPLSVPINAVSNAVYRGVNILALWAEAAARQYGSAVWASYKQWQSLDAQVRHGERGTMIIFYRRVEAGVGELDLELLPRYVSRAYWVFNAAQVENYSAPEMPERTPVEINDDVESFVKATDARFEHGIPPASYHPDLDVIRMPLPNWFTGSRTRNPTQAYYAVLLHELTHWTGAKHRLDRQFGRFGDKSYAFEELIAELGAAFMCAAFGITNEPRPDHAAYVASWLEVLNNDSRAIFTAAARAQDAIQYLGELAAAKLDPRPAEEVA